MNFFDGFVFALLVHRLMGLVFVMWRTSDFIDDKNNLISRNIPVLHNKNEIQICYLSRRSSEDDELCVWNGSRLMIRFSIYFEEMNSAELLKSSVRYFTVINSIAITLGTGASLNYLPQYKII